MARRSGMHPEDIKAELRKRFGPLADLSLAWGYDRSAITNTIARPSYSRVVEQLIADALDMPLHELWPDRWTPNGVPLRRKAARIKAIPQRQKRNAA